MSGVVFQCDFQLGFLRQIPHCQKKTAKVVIVKLVPFALEAAG